MAVVEMAQSKEDLKYKIDKTKKGLFVIVKELTHNLYYEHRSDVTPVNNSREDSWWGGEPLNHNADEKKLLEVFKLSKDGQSTSHKLLLGEDLTNDESGEKSFDKFMKNVCHQPAPAFVMFFLMSHGFPKGEFLLARTDTTPVRSCCIDKEQKKMARHGLKGSCFGRSIDKDIIDKIGSSYPDIPKVYVIQTCRGKDCTPMHRDKADKHVPTEPSDIELFTPNHPHTFVYRACIEGNASFVLSKEWNPPFEDGSLLIQYFCEAVKELKKNSSQFDQIMKKVSERDQSRKQADELLELKDDLIGGWIMNVCQRATTKISSMLYVPMVLRKQKLGDLLLQPWSNISQRMQSTDLDRKALQSQLIEALEEYLPQSAHTSQVQRIISACTQHPWSIIACLYKKILDHQNWDIISFEKELQKIQVLDLLDRVVAELKERKVDFNQQPHISNSLCKKLSLLEMVDI